MRAHPSSPRRNTSFQASESNGTGARFLLYLVGFGFFVQVIVVGPPQAPTIGKPSSVTIGEMSHHKAQSADTDDALNALDDLDHVDNTELVPNLSSVSVADIIDTEEGDCPEIREKIQTSKYRAAFEAEFPVRVPIEPVDDWDSIPCVDIEPTCDLKNTTYGHPFLMISFGRSGTTSTWDIIAGLTGEYIPQASEDMGRDKAEGVAFFSARNQTEHGKCWLERLLCEKQKEVKKAYHDGLGKAAIFGSKWKPWHQGLNTTQARQALQWLGTQKQIKVVYNTRNMIDMYISNHKHQVLAKLFGSERTAHCYDDHDIKLSDGTWDKLEEMGIPRGTLCVQIFKEIEARTPSSIPGMLDYFERNVIQTDFAMEMLDYYDVSRVAVTYEKLYFTDHAKEWMKIFRYLGFGPQKDLTKDEVFAKTAFQKTSANDRSKRMSNYDEVIAALKCTRYAEYLD